MGVPIKPIEVNLVPSGMVTGSFIWVSWLLLLGLVGQLGAGAEAVHDGYFCEHA